MKLLSNLISGQAGGILNSVSKILDEVISNKEEIIKAKAEAEKIINDHLDKMKGHAVEIEKLYFQDLVNAREMQKKALEQSDNFSKRFIYYLSCFVLVSATLFGLALFFVDVPEGNRRLVEMFADIYLFAGAILILQFFFGSSQSSHDKNKIIENLK